MAVVVDVIHVSAGHHDVIIVAQMIGEDVRWLILFWYYGKLMSFEEISELIVTPMHHGCARTVKNIVERFEETGQVRMLVLNACLWWRHVTGAGAPVSIFRSLAAQPADLTPATLM